MRERLEAQLQADWNRDTLAVYADHLLAIGDPRGELVAADLQEARASGVELDADLVGDIQRVRWQRAAALLGDDVSQRFVSSSIVLGFFHDLRINETSGDAADNLGALAATPMWPYVRGISIRGRRAYVAAALAALADRHHPWLRRLTVEVYGGARLGRDPLATPGVTADLIDNTPILDTVQVFGRRVFGAFAHPRVVQWALSDTDSVRSTSERPLTLRAGHSR